MLAAGMSPVPAWHVCKCFLAGDLPTCHTVHLTQLWWPNTVNPDRSLLKAERQDTHWADPR